MKNRLIVLLIVISVLLMVNTALADGGSSSTLDFGANLCIIELESCLGEHSWSFGYKEETLLQKGFIREGETAVVQFTTDSVICLGKKIDGTWVSVGWDNPKDDAWYDALVCSLKNYEATASWTNGKFVIIYAMDNGSIVIDTPEMADQIYEIVRGDTQVPDTTEITSVCYDESPKMIKPTTFASVCPEESVARRTSEYTTYLYEMSGLKKTDPFYETQAIEFYNKYIAYLKENGLVVGSTKNEKAFDISDTDGSKLAEVNLYTFSGRYTICVVVYNLSSGTLLVSPTPTPKPTPTSTPKPTPTPTPKLVDLSKAKAGDRVLFGSYEQDNNKKNGKEQIEWIVLEKKGQSLLLLSRYSLDAQPYNSKKKSVGWEKSSVRKWLNGTFLKAAFNSKEKKQLIATITAKGVSDKVFLLSSDEVKTYLPIKEDRICSGTAYLQSKGYYGNCDWLLRSRQLGGNGLYNIEWVRETGGILGGMSIDSKCEIRPAIWITIG